MIAAVDEKTTVFDQNLNFATSLMIFWIGRNAFPLLNEEISKQGRSVCVRFFSVSFQTLRKAEESTTLQSTREISYLTQSIEN
jgi:hypothetical protein